METSSTAKTHALVTTETRRNRENLTKLDQNGAAPGPFATDRFKVTRHACLQRVQVKSDRPKKPKANQKCRARTRKRNWSLAFFLELPNLARCAQIVDAHLTFFASRKKVSRTLTKLVFLNEIKLSRKKVLKMNRKHDCGDSVFSRHHKTLGSKLPGKWLGSLLGFEDIWLKISSFWNFVSR